VLSLDKLKKTFARTDKGWLVVSVKVARLLCKLKLAFRSHNESSASHNCGNFQEAPLESCISSQLQIMLANATLIHGASRALTTYLSSSLKEILGAIPACSGLRLDGNVSRHLKNCSQARPRLMELMVCPQPNCKAVHKSGTACRVCGSTLLVNNSPSETAVYACVKDCIEALLRHDLLIQSLGQPALPGFISRTIFLIHVFFLPYLFMFVELFRLRLLIHSS
jgi:hypothetical protein